MQGQASGTACSECIGDAVDSAEFASIFRACSATARGANDLPDLTAKLAFSFCGDPDAVGRRERERREEENAPKFGCVGDLLVVEDGDDCEGVAADVNSMLDSFRSGTSWFMSHLTLSHLTHSTPLF